MLSIARVSLSRCGWLSLSRWSLAVVRARLARKECGFCGIAHRALDLSNFAFAQDLDGVLLDGRVENAALGQIDELFAGDEERLCRSERKQSQHLTVSMHAMRVPVPAAIVKV